MVFRTGKAKTYKLRLSVPAHLERKPRTLGCGTADKGTAQEMERMVKRMKRRREWAPLLAVLDGKRSLAALYDADVTGTVEAFVREANDQDLSPLVEELVENAKYRDQIRCLMPDGVRYPASRFNKAAISTFLDGLSCSNSTKNRYRAALSVFAGRLVERGVLEHNPVRDVKGKKKNRVEFVYLRPEQYRALVQIADQKYKPLFALLYGTGMEIGAALAARRRDVDPERKTVWAHGTKTLDEGPYRDRECAVDEWAWPIVWAHVKRLTPDAPLFPPAPSGLRGRNTHPYYSAAQANRQHHALLELKKYPPMRLHNTRHSFAVAHRRAGDSDSWIAAQLGHADTHMVEKTYANYKPDPVKDRVRQALS